MNTKINADFLNPIEKHTANLAANLNPYYKSLNMTPNHVTTLSLLAGMGAIYHLLKRQYIWTILFIFISYFFDVSDGNYAREYNMVSKFGKLYDHFKDVAVHLSIVYILIVRNNKVSVKTRGIIACVLIIGTLGLSLGEGCMQKYREKHDSKYKKKRDKEMKNEDGSSDDLLNTFNQLHDQSYDVFKDMCHDDPDRWIKYSKYLGGETYIVLLTLLLLSLHYRVLR